MNGDIVAYIHISCSNECVQGAKHHTIPIRLQSVARIGRDSSKCVAVIRHLSVSQVHFVLWAVAFDTFTSPVLYLLNASRHLAHIQNKVVRLQETTILCHGDCVKFSTIFSLTIELVQSCDQPEMSCPIQHLNLVAKRGWQIGNVQIGKGSFGVVYLATPIADESRLLAIKIVKCRDNHFPIHIKREALLLMLIDHPNIVSVHDAFFSKTHCYIVENLVCGGDLFLYMVSGSHIRALPELEAQFVVFQLAKALHYLHDRLLIIHRDLKLDNILLETPTPFARIYLCDFGIARQLSPTCLRTRTAVGSAEYSAPEVFGRMRSGYRGPSAYGSKCDMWLLGIIAYILLTGVSPLYQYRHSASKAAHKALSKIRWDIAQFDQVSPQALDFIKMLLQNDPAKRPSAVQCLSHPWLANNAPDLDAKYLKIMERKRYDL